MIRLLRSSAGGRGRGKLGWVALWVALVAAGCQRKPAVTTLPVDERERIKAGIAFISERSGGPETFFIRPTGQGERRLVEGAFFPSAASPDGNALLLIEVEEVGEEHREQLWVQPLPEGARVKVGAKAMRVRSPSWSKDGGAVLFTSSAEGFSDLITSSADGARLTRLTSDPQGAFEPSFSPDAQDLVYVSTKDGNPELYRMGADGKAPRRLTTAAGEDTAPAWSPAGNEIAFLSNRDGADRIHVMAPDGTAQRPLAPAPEAFVDRELAWSPDGATLAFVRREGMGASRIWVVEPATGASRALTDGKSEDAMPAWSPDGRYLAYSSDRTGDTELFLMRSDGTAQTQLTRSKGPDWRPVWVPEARSNAQ